MPDRNSEQRRKRLDLLQKIAATIARLEISLGRSGTNQDEDDDEFAKLVAKLEEEKKLSQSEKKALMMLR